MVEVETSNGSNPYVGPRTYLPDEADKFFGRRREQRELEALIVSRRSVLFYAASGAGKSSLLFTKVLPDLAKDGFEVLPVGSVSGHDGRETEVDNIYVYNLLSSLQQAGEEPPEMATLTLAEFLDRLVYKDGLFVYDEAYVFDSDEELKPRVLVIDQFEEILTTNSAFWQQREGFFRQLGEALAADEQLWLVLTIREDFVAGLDPYLDYLPERLRYRYYMQQLNRRAALQAITRPVETIRPFDEEAAGLLVDNLLAIREDGDGEKAHASQFVEPVQLQAVCYQMWQKLRERPGDEITVQDVTDFADVDKALIAFYEDTIAGTVADTDVAEIDLRSWFESELITEAGTRNMVYRGDEWTGSLPTAIVEEVLKRFILREVVRPGGVWYELVHDRFVPPILESNKEWRLDQPLLRLAQQWDDGGRRLEDLLDGRQLERFLDTNWGALGPLVNEFVETSQRVRATEAEAARRRRQIVVAIVAGLGVALGLFGLWSAAAASRNAARAETNLATAEAAQAVALREATIASGARATAVAERFIAVTQEANALAQEANAIVARETAEAAQAQAEVNADLAAEREAEALASKAEVEVLSRRILASRLGESSAVMLERDPELALMRAAAGLGLSAQSDTIARFYDATFTPFRRSLEGHTDGVYSASFSPDGERIVTASADRSAKVWDLEGNELASLEGHTKPLTSASFSPDGERIVTASWDGSAKVWAVYPARAEEVARQRLGDEGEAFSEEACRRFFRDDPKSCPGTLEQLWALFDDDREQSSMGNSQ